MEGKNNFFTNFNKTLNSEEIPLILSSILDYAPLLIGCLDSHFNFIFVNHAYAEAEERAIEFFPGKNYFHLYPNEEKEVIFRRVVESGKPHFAYEKLFEDFTSLKNNSSNWVWSLIPIFNPQNIVKKLVIFVQNANRNKSSEEQLKTIQIKYNDLS